MKRFSSERKKFLIRSRWWWWKMWDSLWKWKMMLESRTTCEIWWARKAPWQLTRTEASRLFIVSFIRLTDYHYFFTIGHFHIFLFEHIFCSLINWKRRSAMTKGARDFINSFEKRECVCQLAHRGASQCLGINYFPLKIYVIVGLNHSFQSLLARKSVSTGARDISIEVLNFYGA